MNRKRKLFASTSKDGDFNFGTRMKEIFAKKQRGELKKVEEVDSEIEERRKLLESELFKAKYEDISNKSIITALESEEILIRRYTKGLNLYDQEEIVKYFNKNGKLENIKMIKDLDYYTFDDVKIKEDETLKVYHRFKNILTNDKLKVYMVLKTLNKDQFEFIVKFLNRFQFHMKNVNGTGSIGLLDAPAGTGKSFTIIALMIILNSNLKLTFSVYKHDLLNISRLSNFKRNRTFKTIASLFYSLTGVHHMNKTTLYDGSDPSLEFTVFKMMAFSKYLEFSDDILIIDEYTILSPSLCMLLILFARLRNKFVLFLGDKLQQTSIMKTKFHNKWNYSFVKPDFEHCFKKQQRIQDDAFNEMLLKLREDIHDEEKRIPPSYLFNFYKKFKDYFYMQERFDEETVFVSSWHTSLAEKLRGFLTHQPDFKIAPFHAFDSIRWTDSTLDITKPWKFAAALPLKVGYYYLYTKITTEYFERKVSRYIVKLKEIGEKHLLVENDEIGVELIDDKVKMDSFYMLDEHVNSIKAEIKREQNFDASAIYNWPIQPFFIKTLYSVQGLTFPKDMNLEICLDHITFNALYVALTRVKNKKNLGKIHSRLLHSFEYSEFVNDGFLYHLDDDDEKKWTESGFSGVGYLNYQVYPGNGILKGKKELLNKIEAEEKDEKPYLFEILSSQLKENAKEFREKIQNPDKQLLKSLRNEGIIAVTASCSPYRESYNVFCDFVRSKIKL